MFQSPFLAWFDTEPHAGQVNRLFILAVAPAAVALKAGIALLRLWIPTATPVGSVRINGHSMTIDGNTVSGDFAEVSGLMPVDVLGWDALTIDVGGVAPNFGDIVTKARADKNGAIIVPVTIAGLGTVGN